MESRTIRINSKYSSKIALKIIPGHFATTHSHINYYIDMTTLKIRQSEAGEVAKNLAGRYSSNTIIDTIVCMDGTEVIGAYLADFLTQNGILSLNAHNTMYIISPEYNNDGQIIFRDNNQLSIQGKNVLILMASATTGKTIERCIDCIQYYGGRIAGIAAVFSAIKKVAGCPVESVFDTSDIPDYQTFAPHDCPYCRAQQKLDAIVNSYGYSKV